MVTLSNGHLIFIAFASWLVAQPPPQCSGDTCLGIGSLWLCSGIGERSKAIEPLQIETTCYCDLNQTRSQSTIRSKQRSDNSTHPIYWVAVASLFEGVCVCLYWKRQYLSQYVCRIRRARTSKERTPQTIKDELRTKDQDSSAIHGRSELVARARASQASRQDRMVVPQPRQ